MATNKKDVAVEVVAETVTKFKGSQLLKIEKYNNRVARVLIKPDESYSIEEVDELISNFMKKKG